MIWIVNYNKEIFTEIAMIHMKNFQKFSFIFFNHQTPLKEKQIRGHVPLMTKVLSKAIMEKSKSRKKYLKWPFRESYVSYKKSKNRCNKASNQLNAIRGIKKFMSFSLKKKFFLIVLHT